MYKKKQFVLGLVLATLLTACNTAISEPSAPVSSEAPASSVANSEVPFDIKNSLSRPLESAREGAPEFQLPLAELPAGVTQPNTFMSQINDVYWPIGFDALNAWPTELTEVQKILVVPVSFTNKSKVPTEAVREDITKTFFGAPSETGWESVASYYYKSSRGKLNLTGQVTPWVNLGIRTSDIKNSEDVENKIIKKIYSTLPASTLREYDLNQDGWLDALWIVYGADIQQSGNENFWAYVSWVYSESNMNKPYPGVFGWASYKFMYEGADSELPQFLGENGEKKVDAHTFIHETGHMLGLSDYYDYNGKKNPSGGIDMMGNNIIDHNAYSKFLLQWNQPYVPNDIEEETLITLRPATTSGDFILLQPNWNGSVFDEYILIEYYTSDVLNAQDSLVAYNTEYSGAQAYRQSGARVWHVDSSLWAGPIKGGWFSSEYRVDPDPETGDVYVDVPWENNPANEDTEDPYFVYFSASNTNGDSRLPDINMLKLVDSSGVGSYYTDYRKNSTGINLFRTGQEITDWDFYLKNGTGKFNDGSDIGFSVRFGNTTENGLEVFITKTA